MKPEAILLLFVVLGLGLSAGPSYALRRYHRVFEVGWVIEVAAWAIFFSVGLLLQAGVV